MAAGCEYTVNNQKFSEKDFKEYLLKEGLYKFASEGINFGGNPPISNKESVNDNEGDGTGITHAATSETRSKIGAGEYEKKTKTDEQLEAQAEEKIKSGYNIEKLISNIEKGHQPTDVENTILKKYKAVLEAKVDKDPSDENIANLYRLVKATDAIGSEQGRALRSRQGMELVDDSLGGYFVREMDANNVDKLTDEQKATVKNEYEEIKKAKEVAEKKLSDLEEENSKLKAENELNKNKKTVKRTRKTHEDFVKERSSIIEHLRGELKSIRGETSAVAVPYARELVAIAPDVARLVKSLVEEGVTKLEDVVKNIHGQLKDVIPDIKEKDVQDIIAGAYTSPKKTKNEISAAVRDLKTEASLLRRLDALENGEPPATERAKIERNKRLKELQDKIKNLLKLNAEENKFFGEEFDTTSKNIKSQIKRIEGQVSQLNEDIKTGNFEKAAPESKSIFENKELQKKYPQLYKEALDAKDRLIKLKTEREIRLLREQYANRSKFQKVKDVATNILNTPRTIMASVDYSAPLRQGLIPTISHPVTASKAFVEMFKQSISQKRFDRWHYDLQESPEYKVMEESGLYVADPHNPILSAKEEQFMNNLAEKIPVVGKLIKGSERAYTAYLNKMRVDLFNKAIDAFQSDGKTFENSPELYKGMANFINNATGRGGLGKLETSAQMLNTAFFSPRLIAARLNMINPVFYSRLPKEVRVKALASMAKFIGVGLSVLALAKLNGLQVENDPRSSDFGKIKSGDTRWDIWGGFQQYIRVFTQLLTGERKSTKTGGIEVLGKKYGSQNRLDLLISFFRGKLSPIPAEGANILAGKNLVGQPFSPSVEAQNLFEPLLLQDIQDAWKTKGVQSIFSIGIPSAFGVGVQTQVPVNKSKNTGEGGGATSKAFGM